jgi:hypothetical protein
MSTPYLCRTNEQHNAMNTQSTPELIAELDRLLTYGCRAVKPCKVLPASATWAMMKASTSGNGFTAWMTASRTYIVHDTFGILRIVNRNA